MVKKKLLLNFGNIENPIFLKSKYKHYYQEPLEITVFIRENFVLIDQIDDFFVYAKE